MPSLLAVLFWGTLTTPAVSCIMFICLDIESGLIFLPMLEVAIFKEVFHKINRDLITQLIKL